MKNFSLLLFLLPMLFITSCFGGDSGNKVQSVPSLISEGFISDTEYEIVCIGIPKEGLKGFQKEESAKRAALLNVYYFAKNRFDESVQPDVDGKIEKFTMLDDHAEMKYVIKKSGLKKRVKK